MLPITRHAITGAWSHFIQAPEGASGLHSLFTRFLGKIIKLAGLIFSYPDSKGKVRKSVSVPLVATSLINVLFQFGTEKNKS